MLFLRDDVLGALLFRLHFAFARVDGSSWEDFAGSRLASPPTTSRTQKFLETSTDTRPSWITMAGKTLLPPLCFRS